MATTPSFDYPANTPIYDDRGTIQIPWGQWLSRVNAIANTGVQSGPTADRPTANLWIGRQYYDTTLGYPVFVNSVRPTVWHNAAGAVV